MTQPRVGDVMNELKPAPLSPSSPTLGTVSLLQETGEIGPTENRVSEAMEPLHTAGIVPEAQPRFSPRSTRSIAATVRRKGLRWGLRYTQQLLRARIQLRSCNEVGKWVRVRGQVRVINQGTIKI